VPELSSAQSDFITFASSLSRESQGFGGYRFEGFESSDFIDPTKEDKQSDIDPW